MKTRFRFTILLLVFCLFAAPFARAESGLNETEKGQTQALIRQELRRVTFSSLVSNLNSEQLRTLQICITSNLTEKVVSLESQTEDLRNNIEQLKEKVERLEQHSGNLDSPPPDDGSEGYGRSFPWILVGVVGVILVVLLLGKRHSQPPAEPGRPKCPRCGKEYDPGDTVCTNPDCKTQF